MISSLWPHNDKVAFAIVSVGEKEFLVCHSNVGQARIRFVEDLETGVRKIPTSEQRKFASSQEELLEALVGSF